MHARRFIIGIPVGLAWLTAAAVMLAGRPGDSTGRFPRGHAELACSQCHTLTASTATAGAMPDFNRACRECHRGLAEAPTALKLNFHTDATQDCTRCHSFHNVERISAGASEFSFAFENPRQRSQCYACHGGRESLAALSPGHRRAASLFHSDYRYSGGLSVSDACMVCHAESGSQSLVPVERGEAPTFDFHGSHPVGIEVHPGAGRPGNWIRTNIDRRLVLSDGRLECTTCHSLSSGTTFHLAGFENRDDLCRGCHMVDGDPPAG